MNEDNLAESEILLSPRILKELNKACRDSKSRTWAQKPLKDDYNITLREILWYVVNQVSRLPKNHVEYVGALRLLTKFELTEAERRAVANTLIPIINLTKRSQLNRLLLNVFHLSGWLAAFTLLPWLASYGHAPVLAIAIGVLIFIPMFRALSQVPSHFFLRVTSVVLLGELGVPEAIPVLAREAVNSPMGMSSGQPAMAISSAYALFKLLPTLTSNHYRAFDQETIPNLYTLLATETKKMTPNAMERVELLVDALEKIGDSRAIIPVQALKRQLMAKQSEFEDRQLRAQTASWQRSVLETNALPQVTAVENPYRNLQRKAERLLSTLEERRVQEELHDNLLRGSSVPQDTSELLRPVTGKTEQEPPEQLLRGVNHEEAESP